IKAFNTRFVAMLFRQMGLVLGRPAELDEVGISHEEALDQVNSLLWEGLLPRSSKGSPES
ncbi:MAG: hypothetical protein P4L93_10315, partial [Coriobacteriia bacterium]|nr:hypothetical protein [Coriobacteriia bacterium]